MSTTSLFGNLATIVKSLTDSEIDVICDAAITVGVVNSDNSITLTGLDAGTYTLKYENEDGTLTEIGSLVVE